jgi:hypothetical protein
MCGCPKGREDGSFAWQVAQHRKDHRSNTDTGFNTTLWLKMSIKIYIILNKLTELYSMKVFFCDKYSMKVLIKDESSNSLLIYVKFQNLMVKFKLWISKKLSGFILVIRGKYVISLLINYISELFWNTLLILNTFPCSFKSLILVSVFLCFYLLHINTISQFSNVDYK